ncbi:hypothetical protein Acsp01_79200 [Actinoplanes sp. NBRC 101535]|nr:hypothetical protein Acsp01_79200 [Actinoplanes sp. NBRC 101535]
MERPATRSDSENFTAPRHSASPTRTDRRSPAAAQRPGRRTQAAWEPRDCCDAYPRGVLMIFRFLSVVAARVSPFRSPGAFGSDHGWTFVRGGRIAAIGEIRAGLPWGTPVLPE